MKRKALINSVLAWVLALTMVVPNTSFAVYASAQTQDDVWETDAAGAEEDQEQQEDTNQSGEDDQESEDQQSEDQESEDQESEDQQSESQESEDWQSEEQSEENTDENLEELEENQDANLTETVTLSSTDGQNGEKEHFRIRYVRWANYMVSINLEYYPVDTSKTYAYLDGNYVLQELDEQGKVVREKKYTRLYSYGSYCYIGIDSYTMQKETKSLRIQVNEVVNGETQTFATDCFTREFGENNPVFTIRQADCGVKSITYNWEIKGYSYPDGGTGDIFGAVLKVTDKAGATQECSSKLNVYDSTGVLEFSGLNPDTTYTGGTVSLYIQDEEGRDLFRQNVDVPSFTTGEEAEYNFAEIMPDEVLRKRVANLAGLSGQPETVKKSALESIKSLWASRYSESEAAIKNLKGIEYLTKLTYISITNHEIEDISSIEWKKIPGLENLFFKGNNISKAVDFSELPGLNLVDLTENMLTEETISQIKDRLPAGAYGDFDDQRTYGSEILVEPVYYRMNGVTTVLTKVKGVRSSFPNTISMLIDNGACVFQKRYDEVYYYSDPSLTLGEHTLKVIINGEEKTKTFQVKEDAIEISPMYLDSGWERASLSIYTSSSNEIVKAEIIDQQGKVYGVSDSVSRYKAYSDDRYQIIGEKSLFYIGDLYSRSEYSVYLTSYMKRTPAGTYDLKLSYQDNTTELIPDVFRITAEGQAIVSSIYDQGGYDNTGEYLYIVLRGTNVDLSMLEYVAEDKNGEHPLVYESCKKAYGGYVLKLRRDGWRSGAGDRLKISIKAKDGYSVIFVESEKELSLASGIFYVNWNEAVNKVEVAVTQDVTVSSIQAELKKKNSSGASAGTQQYAQYASGEATQIQQNFALIDMKNADGEAVVPEYGQYELKVYINGKRNDSKTVHLQLGRNTSTNIWYAANKFLKGATGISYAYVTNMSYEEYKNDSYQLVVLDASEKEVYAPKTKLAMVDGYLEICTVNDDFCNLPAGFYQMVAKHEGKVLSSYTFEIVTTDKFLLGGQSAQWMQNEKDSIQLYLSTLNVDSVKNMVVEMYDPYGNKVEGIKTSFLRSYQSSVYLKITGIKKADAYRKYWIKVSSSTLGDPYMLNNRNAAYYSNEMGQLVSLSESSPYFARYNDTRRIYRFIPGDWEYPITITAYLPYDTAPAASFTANTYSGKYTDGQRYIDLPKSFYNQLPDKDRLYDVVASDSAGNSTLTEKTAVWYYQSAVKLTGIAVAPTTLKLAAGETGQLSVTPKPANAVLTSSLRFISSNEKVAQVDESGKVIAVGCGTAKITVKASSFTATCSVTVTEQVKAPKADMVSGEVAKNTLVTLTSETAGAVIYYTLDGSDPTAGSAKYTAPIQITKETRIRAIATKKGYADSEIAEFTYQVPEVRVTFDTDGGSPESETQILRKGDYLNMYHVAEPRKDGYRFDGWYVGDEELDPTRAVNESMIVKARWSVAEKLTAPMANYPDGKSLPEDAVVTFTAGKGSEIYYTLDGSDPTKESSLYQDAILLTKDLWREGELTIKAMASAIGCQDSDIAVYRYTRTENPAIYGEVESRDLPEGEIPAGTWIAGLEDSYSYTGKAIKPEIRVYDHKRRLVLNKDYSIAYKNNINAGEAQILVTGKGNYSSRLTQTFVIEAKSIEDGDILAADITVAGNSKVQKKTPAVQWNGKTLAVNKDFTVHYEENTPDSFKTPGKYRIILTGRGNYTGSITVIETITDAKSDQLIEKMKFSAVKAQSYTGKEICPEITVTDKKTVLKEGTDYEVEYRNNVAVGTATMVLRGLGDYKGEKRISFKINGTSMKKVQVSGLTDLTYETGKTIYEQDGLQLTFKKSKTEIITLPEDAYTVHYTNNSKAGNATVTFTGIPEKGYTGTIKKVFRILAGENLSNAEITCEAEVPYCKGGAKPKVTVVVKDKVLVENMDYVVSYKNNTKLHDGKAKNVPTVTIQGKGNYMGQATRTFAITEKATGALTATADDVVWSNKKSNYTTKVTILDTDGKKLSAGTDYDKNFVYYAGGRELEKNELLPAGTEITVKTTGKGNYSGEISSTYRIGMKKFSKITARIPNQTYTGEEITLHKEDLTIIYKEGKNTVALTPADFEIIGYQNNEKKGTARVTLKGLGNYAGTKTVTFKIESKPIKK